MSHVIVWQWRKTPLGSSLGSQAQTDADASSSRTPVSRDLPRKACDTSDPTRSKRENQTVPSFFNAWHRSRRSERLDCLVSEAVSNTGRPPNRPEEQKVRRGRAVAARSAKSRSAVLPVFYRFSWFARTQGSFLLKRGRVELVDGTGQRPRERGWFFGIQANDD